MSKPTPLPKPGDFLEAVNVDGHDCSGTVVMTWPREAHVELLVKLPTGAITRVTLDKTEWGFEYEPLTAPPNEIPFRPYAVPSEAHANSKKIVIAQNCSVAKAIYIQLCDSHSTVLWSDLVAIPTELPEIGGRRKIYL